MIDLAHTLHNADAGLLKIIADAWGFTLHAPDAPALAQKLAAAMRDPQIVDEVVAALPPEAARALQDLLVSSVIPWPQFTNRYGELREMGPAKRDRERPHLHPLSAVEVLWYRGLIGKAFFALDGAPREYAYIPTDLAPLVHLPAPEGENPYARPAAPGEYARIIPAHDRILDDVCTLLAALRMDMPPAEIPAGFVEIPAEFLTALLTSAGVIDAELRIQPEAARAMLEDSRGVTLARLAGFWFESQKVNELRMLPHLRFEGAWFNQPLETRRFLLDLLQRLPEDAWLSLDGFIAAVREHSPDFQRPAGDYDSWFIQEKSSGAYLRGRTSWDKVEGVLIRFMLCGPLHWLGLVDLGAPAVRAKTAGKAKPAAFRLSGWAADLWLAEAPAGLPEEDTQLFINMDGRMRIPALTPRSARYQAARFSEWETRKAGQYIYRITAQSLQKAAGQGLKVSHLLAILKKHASGGIPPAFQQTLLRWEKQGLQTSLVQAALLQVDQPEILSELLKTPAKRFLGQVLNPTTVEILPGGEESVRDALLQIGYFSGSAKALSGNPSAPIS
jgi:hypothetical protein